MRYLPENMQEDVDNKVYYDTGKGEFYLIEWKTGDEGVYPIRHYIKEFENSRSSE